MIRFLTLLIVGIFLAAPLNSGNTNKFWLAPIAATYYNDKILTPPEDIPRMHRDLNKSADAVLTDPQELECMSKNIYFESAMESTAGKLAVAQVTLNRVKSRHYPNTVCSVVKQGKHSQNGFPVRDRCQFSWYCDGKHDTPSMGKMWGESQKVAIYVLENAKLLDITDGATHYHADYIENPRWAIARHKTMQIDTHIFYNKNKKRHL